MKFAIRYFKSVYSKMKVENIGVLVVLGAIAGFIIGIPFMFIGGYKPADMLIPVIIAAIAAILPYFILFAAIAMYFFSTYRIYSVYNRKGYSAEYLEVINKLIKKEKTPSVTNKLIAANTLRTLKRFDEAEREFEELSDFEMNDDERNSYLTFYLILALQTKNYDLHDNILNKNKEYIEEKMNGTRYAFHINLYRECVMGNYDTALEACEQSIEDNNPFVGFYVYTAMIFLFTEMGMAEKASEMTEKAYKAINEEKTTYDWEPADYRKRIEKALSGELVPPFTQV